MNTTRSNVWIVALLGLVLLAACGPGPTPPATTALPPTSQPAVSPEHARDEAIAYIIAHHPEAASLLNVDTWHELPRPTTQVLATYGFEGGDWTVWVSVWPAGLVEHEGETLQQDVLALTVKHAAPPPYIFWQGEYSEGSGISEDRFVHRETAVEPIEPSVARDIAFSHIAHAHTEVTAPAEPWEEAGVVDVEVGVSRYTYTAGGWEVVVTWDAYIALYQVVAHYESTTDSTHIEIDWQVQLGADGVEIEELHFQYWGGV